MDLLRDLPDLRRSVLGLVVSAVGDQMAVVALLLLVYSHGAGPWAVSLLLVVQALPIAALAGWAGRVSDRYDSRRLLVLCAAAQAVGCLALAAGGPLWVTLTLVLLVQCGEAVAAPTWSALVPVIAGADRTGPAVGLIGSSRTVSMVVGPALAGVLSGVGGPRLPLLVDAVSFVLLGVVALRITARRGGVATSTGGDDTTAPDPGLAVSGLRLLRADQLVWPLVVGLMAFVVVAEGSNVVDVYLVRQALGASSTTYGLVVAVMATGLVVGSLVGGRGHSDLNRAWRTVLAALTLSATLVLSGLSPSIWVLAPVTFALGWANGIANTQVSTLLLTRLPSAALGRVMATVNGLARAGAVVGLAGGGLAGGLWGPRATFVGCGLLSLAVTAAIAVRLRRASATRPDERADLPRTASDGPGEATSAL
jgi:MFS family permease